MYSLNYFSHYYFDRHDASQIHNFGLVIPDFVRNFMKGKRLKPGPVGTAHSDDLQMLHTGALKHFERDARFHNSTYFHTVTGDLGQILKPAFEQAGIPRYWWGAHLLAEMMLDRVLILQEPELIRDFYRDLKDSDDATVRDYLEMAGLHEHSDFFMRLDRFRELQYLMRYVEDDAMVYSLSRVYQYAGVSPEWTREQSLLVAPVIPELENRIFESLPNLMEEMT